MERRVKMTLFQENNSCSSKEGENSYERMMNLEDLMNCLMFESYRTTEQLDYYCNVYQFGSRVYGTAREDSDYDFFVIIHDNLYEWLNLNYKRDCKEERNHHEFENQWIVVHNDEEDKTRKTNDALDEGKLMEMTKDGREFQCLTLWCKRTGFEVNVNLFKHSSFRKRLKHNWLQALMCVNMESKFVWRVDFPELNICYKIYLRRLVVSGITEAGGHFRLAKKYWSDKSNNHYRSKKYIAHTFRDLLLVRQLINHCKIVDYSEANNIYYDLLNRQFENDEQFERRNQYHDHATQKDML